MTARALPKTVAVDVKAASRPQPAMLQADSPARRRWPRLVVLLGWCWRLAVGTLFCLNYFTSIVVVGWLYRWMRARAVHHWWKQSPDTRRKTFEDFCTDLEPNAIAVRPRWFILERVSESLRQPTADGKPPGRIRRLLRVTAVPWHSLWVNAKLGLHGLICTYLMTGWGCGLIVFSWWFGWVNSFHKGYEQALIGPLTGVLGIFVFALAMFYTPMAQVHLAVTGRPSAFFDFRFIWRLVQAKLGAYTALAALVLAVSIPFEVLKTLPLYFELINPALETASNQELLWILRRYLFVCALLLFVALLLLRAVAARIYAGAVLTALRTGALGRDDLHPVIAEWLDRLGIDTQPVSLPHGFARVVKSGARTLIRPVRYGFLLVIWLAFSAKTYVGEFLNYHPFFGFMNHPLIQFPSFDFVPKDL
jgi:hypothetical protein